MVKTPCLFRSILYSHSVMNTNIPAALLSAVKFTNQENATLNAFTAEMRQALTPFLGKKILKADQSLVAGVAKALNVVIDKYKAACPGLRIWHSYSQYNLFFNFVVIGGSTHCVFLGSINTGVLTDMPTWNEAKTDHSALQIYAAYTEQQVLQKRLAELKQITDAFSAVLNNVRD